MTNKVVIFDAHHPDQIQSAKACIHNGDKVLLLSDYATEQIAILSQHKQVQVRLGVRPHAMTQMATAVIR